jgi:alanyl-tRNA synthetase
MKGAEIRSKFLKYFERHGHTIVESSGLVPQNDPTILFNNAGMNQFKDVFLGKESRPYKRATTSQKCVRAGGKHNDLENVGFTARHHTFFEMLGNFSFGDYFKKDAIRFAWEFVTHELGLPKDKLYVSVFKDDDEAAEIWHKQEGVPKERIFRFGEKDNFWSMGDTGPCGPCSELFIDRGEKYGCGKSTCTVGCDCDRFMEFWNLVFMQFDRSADGKLTPLPKPSVDTGAGLERIASILQDAPTNYDTDLFQEILQKTAKLLGNPYDPKSKDAVSFRVIADHSRATAFLIGDGVMPSNEGRGYVLRRIMRRAIRHGQKLGFKGAFLHKTAGFVIDQMAQAYPDLKDKRAFIEKATLAEEEQFLKTLERGLAILDEETSKLGSGKTLSGEVAFKLYDSFGFPLDLTRVILSEKGLTADEAGFEKSMERQREMARKNWKGSGEEALSGIYLKLSDELRDAGKKQKFTGYDSLKGSSACLALLVRKGEELVRAQTASEGLIEVVFSETPFYGESGGQVGDRGHVSGEGFEGEVLDVVKPAPDLIVAKIKPLKGVIKAGSSYQQHVDPELRALTARNHTATHLLHWALREILGQHVKQAGSIVTPELLRFDFSHFQAMTTEEIRKVEDLINARIWSAHSVSKENMSKEAAIAKGAIAMFGEKYGDVVRVVSVGDFSTELCGGTHVSNSADIHLFKVQNESGIAAGVRRIVAMTSKGAFEMLRARDDALKTVRDTLRASSIDEIPEVLQKMSDHEKLLKARLQKLESAALGGEVDALLGSAVTIPGGKLVAVVCSPDNQGVKRLREMTDQIFQKLPDALAVLGVKEPESGKAFLLVARGPKAPKAADANQILQKLAPLIGGRGGGKPDMAQAGGTNPSGLDQAIAQAKTLFT